MKMQTWPAKPGIGEVIGAAVEEASTGGVGNLEAAFADAGEPSGDSIPTKMPDGAALEHAGVGAVPELAVTHEIGHDEKAVVEAALNDAGNRAADARALEAEERDVRHSGATLA
jgi:hypothetical protein